MFYWKINLVTLFYNPKKKLGNKICAHNRANA